MENTDKKNITAGKEFFTTKCDGSKKEEKEGSCPLRELLSRLGDKWSVLLILTLARMPGERARFSELKRSLPDISQRMLTATLRNLERDGLLSRQMFAEVPPRVEYQLTELGLSILNPMREIVQWIEGNWTTIIASREVFDRKSGKEGAGVGVDAN
jgi:DNA-binding HxlR family transcriptional regulator